MLFDIINTGVKMNIEIQNILKKIEDYGYEAYIIGGYVRDYLLNIESTDIDICTNALPKDIIKIFNVKKETSSYGSITIHDGKYNFDITTYRKENNYQNRKPQNIEYTNNLLDDIKRRDFTINSICMNSEGQIFDYLNGQNDIYSRVIRVIGNTYEKLSEDPLRILRAIRFSIILDFDLDEEIISFIKNYKQLVSTLSYTRKKEELDKIFASKNIEKGLNILKEYNLLPYLSIEYDKIVCVPDLLGIWAQIDYSASYPFNKNNKRIISNIRTVICDGVIDNYTLYKYGLYISSVAGEIIGIDKKEINEKYHKLAIKNENDLAIKQSDIIDILSFKPSIKIKRIYKDLIINVIYNKLDNDYETLKDYIITNWKWLHEQ